MLKEATVRIATVEIERNQLAMEWKAGIDLNWTRASAALKATDETYIAALGADMSATTKEVSEKQKQLEALIDSDKGKELLAKVATARKMYVDARAKLLERKKQGKMSSPWWIAISDLWHKITSSRSKTSPITPMTS